MLYKKLGMYNEFNTTLLNLRSGRNDGLVVLGEKLLGVA